MYGVGAVRDKDELIGFLGQRAMRNGSTCVDLVEDCKKATCIHFLCRNKVKSKERKQNC